MERGREGSHILGSIYWGSYEEREGGKVHTYKGPSIEDPIERGKGRFTHIRFHLLRILWREGGREGSHILGSIYWGSYEERREGSHILGSIYWGSYWERVGGEGSHILESIYWGSYGEREGLLILGSIYWGSYWERKGSHISGSIFWGSYAENERGRVYTY